MNIKANIFGILVLASGSAFGDWRPEILSHRVPAVRISEGIVTGVSEGSTNATHQRLVEWQYPVDRDGVLRVTVPGYAYKAEYDFVPMISPGTSIDYSLYGLVYTDSIYPVDPFEASLYDVCYVLQPLNFAAAVLSFGFGGFIAGAFVSMILSWLLDIRKLFA